MLTWLEKVFRSIFSPVAIARVLFILLTVWCGMILAKENQSVRFLGYDTYQRILYMVLAFLIAVAITLVEHATDAISSHKLLMAALGMMVGLIFAHLFYPTIPKGLVDPENALMACNLFFGYFGIILAIKHAQRFRISQLKFMLTQPQDRAKVLDSSVIIDGRIRELIELQVIHGQIMIPNFVLQEIQVIADASDPNRKARGRRGLDVLETLRDTCKELELVDKDYPETAEVDAKLVKLCRDLDADLMTNDYNLQKIAQLHRITTLNVNEIANALKPTVYIGEHFSISIGREGKEQGQGVGYLEDGTMVVVDEAVQFMGQEVPVVVSSILQTSSGRLVFARCREDEIEQPARARA